MTPVRAVAPALHPMMAVACYAGTVCTRFMHSYADSALLLASHGIPFTLRNLDGYCHVDDAYNMLLKFFLDSPCTHVVTVGDDQGWRAQDLLRLVQHGAKYDVVAGIVPKKADPPEWNVVYSTEQLQANADGLIEAYMVGTGFMCLSRYAVERLAAGAEKYDVHGLTNIPLILERRTIGRGRIGGDNMLCMKWRELGGKLYVDPEMHFTHSGNKTWDGCAGDWYRERMRAETQDAA